MKICWDNLENIKLNKNGDFTNGKKVFVPKFCQECGEEFLAFKGSGKGIYCSNKCVHKSKKYRKKMSKSLSGKNNPFYGKKHPKETKEKIGRSSKERNQERNHPNWKGGYNKKNLAFYDTYASKISYAEKVRRNENDPNVLEVKCAYCGKWFIPTLINVHNRIHSLLGHYNGENRSYCSNECKRECPIYNQKLYSKDFKIGTSREVQPELRQMVLERDNWTCQKCGSTKSLHCHHIEGILWEPIESADIDKCITLCKNCHRLVHKQDGCKYSDLQCK